MTDTPKPKRKPKRRKGKGGKRIASIESYEKILEAYRDAPGNHSRASKATGHDRKTCKKVWDNGWAYDWAPPISEVIEREQELARVRVARQTVDDAEIQGFMDTTAAAELKRQEHLQLMKERQAAKGHAIKSRAEEGEMVQGLRKAVMVAEGTMLRCAVGFQELADAVNIELRQLALPGNKNFKVGAAIGYLRRYAATIRETSHAAREAMELERLLLGEPQQIVGIQNLGDLDEATAEQCMDEIERAHRAIARHRERGEPIVAEEPGTPDKIVH